MLHDTECPGSSSNSEQGSTEDWRSTGNSVEQSEQDARYLPVLATTGNPPKTQGIISVLSLSSKDNDVFFY